MELYVYYRVANPRAGPALEAVRAFQQGLRERFAGLEARVLLRSEASGKAPPFTTLMEVYHRCPDPMDEAMIDSINSLASDVLGAWIEGGRHIEVFLPA